jgi:hypothetical protein
MRSTLLVFVALLLLAPPAGAQSAAAHEALQQRIIEIAEGVIPSVVHIEAIMTA